MPFLITRAQSQGTPPLYAVQDGDGDIGWEPNKARATAFTDAEAEAIVADFGRYSKTELTIVGAGKAASVESDDGDGKG